MGKIFLICRDSVVGSNEMDECEKFRSENIVFVAMRQQVERNGELLWQKEVDFRVECLVI